MTFEIGRVSVSHHDGNGTWVIALDGEHDLATLPRLEQQTIDVWSHCALAVVDLSRASFIDSSVVHWLLRARHHVEHDRRRRLVVVDGAPDSFAAHVLGVLGLRGALGCYPTADDALQRVINPGAEAAN